VGMWLVQFRKACIILISWKKLSHEAKTAARESAHSEWSVVILDFLSLRLCPKCLTYNLYYK
jgi:hypothetical protein